MVDKRMKKTLFVLLVALITLSVPFASVGAADPPVLEIVSLRTQYSNTYENFDGSYYTVRSIASVNYEVIPDFYMPIQTDILPSPKPKWDWEVMTGHWKLYVNNDLTIAVKKGDNWIGHKLYGIAYLDVATKEYEIIQTVGDRVPVVNGNSIEWSEVMYGVDYKIRYTNDSLKEDLVIKQSLRDILRMAGNRPADYGLNTATTYLVPIFEMDWSQSLPMKLRSGQNVSPDEAEHEEIIYFESPVKDKYFNTKLVSYMPLDYAVSANPINPEDPEEEWEYAVEKIRKRLIEKNGKHWLLMGVPVLALNAMPEGDIIFDPTETLRPNAAGDEESIPFGTSGAGNHWQDVDEAAADDDTTYVMNTAGAWTRDLYNLPASGVGVGTINHITVHVRGKGGHITNTRIKASIKSGGTVDDSDQMYYAIIDTWENFNEEWAVNPDDSNAWEWSDIDDLQIGVSLLGYPVTEKGSYCTQVYVVVDYTALTAPAITTDAATDVQKTTARINSTVTDDGGEACEVRFQWHEDGDPAWGTSTAWVAGYTTGNQPFVDMAGLTSNKQHHYKAQIKNAHSTVDGAADDFTTLVDADEPSVIKVIPEGTRVLLSWTKGTGATNTLIRFKEGSYPTVVTDGAQVYFGALSDCIHTNRLPGNTYYYSAWGESGGGFSAGKADIMATTIAEEEGVTAPDAPSEPSTWFQTPDYTQFVDMPLYAEINTFADSIDMPEETFWLFLALGICLTSGGLTFGLTRRMTPTMIMLAFMFAATSLVGLLPMWMMAFTLLFSWGAYHTKGASE